MVLLLYMSGATSEYQYIMSICKVLLFWWTVDCQMYYYKYEDHLTTNMPIGKVVSFWWTKELSNILLQVRGAMKRLKVHDAAALDVQGTDHLSTSVMSICKVFAFLVYQRIIKCTITSMRWDDKIKGRWYHCVGWYLG